MQCGSGGGNCRLRIIMLHSDREETGKQKSG